MAWKSMWPIYTVWDYSPPPLGVYHLWLYEGLYYNTVVASLLLVCVTVCLVLTGTEKGIWHLCAKPGRPKPQGISLTLSEQIYVFHFAKFSFSASQTRAHIYCIPCNQSCTFLSTDFGVVWGSDLICDWPGNWFHATVIIQQKMW